MSAPGDIDRMPLTAYNFRVVVGARAMSFSEVSGLSREHELVTYRHGLSSWEGERIAKYAHERRVPIIMRKGTLTRDGAFLYAWLEAKSDVPMSIHLCDAQGNAVVGWQIAKAIPVKLRAPTFDARSNEVSIDTLEVLAAGIFITVDPRKTHG